MVPALALTAAMPALGSAELVVDLFAQRLSEGVLAYSGAAQKDQPTAQVRLGGAGAAARVARAAHAAATDIQARVSNGKHVGRTVRAGVRAAAAHVVHESRSVIADLLEAAGASAQFPDNPLQRAKRDVDVISGHVVFDYDVSRELAGALEIGAGAGSTASAQRLGVEQTVAWFEPEVGVDRMTGQATFKREVGSLQHAHGTLVVDIAGSPHAVNVGISAQGGHQHVERFGHQTLAPPTPTDAVTDFSGVRQRAPATDHPDDLVAMLQHYHPGSQVCIDIHSFGDHSPRYRHIGVWRPEQILGDLRVAGNPLKQRASVVEYWQAQ
jgi:hypothetical protein